MSCSVRGCKNKVTAKGWCSKHYMRNKRHGSPTATVADSQAALPTVARTATTNADDPNNRTKAFLIDRNSLYTMSEIAKLFKMSSRSLSDAASHVPSAGEVFGRLAYNLPDVARAVWGLDLSDEDSDDPYAGLKPGERKAIIESQLKYVDLQAKLGFYTSTDALHYFIAEKFKTIDIALSTLPDHIEREVGLSPEQLAIVDREIDKLRLLLTEQEVT